VAGDEMSRTQQGNNNAYCQDNEISWVNWQDADLELREFTRQLIALRRNHPTFCRRKWFQGQSIKGIGVEDIAWFQPEGIEMTEEHWNLDHAKSMAVYLNGSGLHSLGPRGEQITDDNFFLIFNAHYESLDFRLPPEKYGNHWTKILDTRYSKIGETETFGPESLVEAEGYSVVVLRQIAQ
jgi:isoamylase